MGASLARRGINFAIYSRHATEAWLVLGEGEEQVEIGLDPVVNRTGHVWHILVRGVDSGVRYAWRFDRQPNSSPHLHRYDPSYLLLDPYALAIVGGEDWGAPQQREYRPLRCVVPDTDFDWEYDQPLNVPLADSVIYEMHVRGFTRHSSSGVANPGTFAGVIEKIPYLKRLGVTAVELLPVNEFEEADTNLVNPLTGERLLNLWGYQPIAFFAPNASYSSNPHDGGQVREFKEMVKRLHQAGIEVILDVVFNHTSEGDERGPVRGFRGIDNATYYILDPATGHYKNYSGCGNTLNCNHPVVRRMIVDAIEYWVTQMHVDGFRFDLASILGRGQDGSVLSNPPLLEELAGSPVLASTKLIAEAWDAAGLYQVGTFPAWGRWAEWNGKYRDDVRRFVRGEGGMTSTIATRLLGSPDLYLTSAREPYHSINFVTCHDGFTLRDLVSYDRKRNEANAENNADGSNENFSWNCGAEGAVEDEAINALRLRQTKNFAALLTLSHGVPMILAGDEMGRTQHGNNNAYCQDNETSWIDWNLAQENGGLVRFFERLIAFRKGNPLLCRTRYAWQANGESLGIAWHGVKRNRPDWGPESRSVAMQLSGYGRELFLVANAYWGDLDFELPRIRGSWRRLINTAFDSPFDIADPGEESPLSSQDSYRVHARSVCVFVA
jgi:glycogen operon protein